MLVIMKIKELPKPVPTRFQASEKKAVSNIHHNFMTYMLFNEKIKHLKRLHFQKVDQKYI